MVHSCQNHVSCKRSSINPRDATRLAIMYTLQLAVSNQKINSDFARANSRNNLRKHVPKLFKLTVIGKKELKCCLLHFKTKLLHKFTLRQALVNFQIRFQIMNDFNHVQIFESVGPLA